MNIWDIVVIIVVAAVLILAFRLYAGVRKKGSGCGCGCADCSAPCAFKQQKDPDKE